CAGIQEVLHGRMDWRARPEGAGCDAAVHPLDRLHIRTVAEMSRRQDDKVATVSFEPEFGPSGSLRQAVGKGGRAHVDRWLPFIILNRGDEGVASLSKRIAIESPSYLVWPAGDDTAALKAIREVVTAMASKAGRLLVISLDD